MAARGGRTGLLGATHGGFAGRRAQTWFAAICARWGVACTAPDGGRRSILQAISVFLNLKNDSLSPSVDIIRRQIAVTFFLQRTCALLLRLCADPARSCNSPDDASPSRPVVH